MNVPIRVRRPIVLLVHATVCAASYYAAFVLRLDDPRLVQGDKTYVPHFLGTLPWLLSLRMLTLQAFGLNRGLWRYAGANDLVRLLAAVGASSLAFWAATSLVHGWKHVPHGVLVIDTALCTLLLGGLRFARRLLGERRRAAPGGARTVVVGAGDAGEAVVREMQRSRRETPVALVDDDPTKQGRSIHGVPVRGPLARLHEVVRAVEATDVVVAIPSGPPDLLRRVAAATEDAGVRVRVVPERGAVRLAALRPMEMGDLLSRPVAALDEARIGADVAGRRLLVTGGAGSIGGELVRRALAYGPASLTIADRDENAVHLLLEALPPERRRLVVARIVDVADPDAIERVLAEARPEYVLHAAAYKHVPLMEDNPVAAVRNNVVATRALLRAADAHGVRKFLLVSSDKAVRPSSVMGATKRAAELALFAEPAAAAVRVAVRFGNVVGSAGSVIPVFLRQIERGGPVTVTHRDATRYFMTIPEAASLVLESAAMARGGEVFHLDMGEPVRILDLARRMVELAGLVPGTDVEIRETGLRPGEKLHEELLADGESVGPTAHPQVRVATAPPPDAARTRAGLDALGAACASGDPRATVRALAALVPEYEPANDGIRGWLRP